MDKERLIEAIRTVLGRHAFVLRAELFGSLARGDDAPDSDVDLVVRLAESVDIFDMAGLGNDLEQEVGRPVSLVPDDIVDRPERESQALFSRNIAADRTLIYERRA